MLKHPPAINCSQLIVGKRLPVLNLSGPCNPGPRPLLTFIPHLG